MSLLNLPNELLLDIAEHLSQEDLLPLLKSNHRLCSLLTHTLHRFAVLPHKSYNGKTLCALHWAAKKRHEPLVRTLISKGLNIDCRECSDSNGETALHFAAWQGSEAIVRLLLQSGADVNAQDATRGRTPLHLATLRAHEYVVKILLEAGADVDVRDHSGRTTLVLWAMKDSRFWNIPAHRNGSVFLLLMEYGARIESGESNVEGWLALREAVGKGQKEIVELLVERSKCTERKSECEELEGWGLRLRRNVEVIKLLQDKGLITAPELQCTLAEEKYIEGLQIDERPPHHKLRGKPSDRAPAWKVKIRTICRVMALGRRSGSVLRIRSIALVLVYIAIGLYNKTLYGTTISAGY